MPLELRPGVVVGDRYRLERLLGEGGMGSVWSATNTVTHGAFALKFLKGTAESPELRRRLLREGRAACAVEHPNVREVHDVLELDDGLPVLVMERLEGESLAQRLARDDKLSIAEMVRILHPVVSAVGAAHAIGVVHRDLKPENIFLTSKNQVKVLDFGIAKVRPLEGMHGDSATSTGMLLGTPCYMAPEQVFGEKDADYRIDIWALGLIMYRAVTGVLPTQADNLGQIMKAIVTRPIRPVEELAPELPSDLAALITRMLARDRDERPANLVEVQAELSKHTDAAAPRFGAPAPMPQARDPIGEVPMAGDTTAVDFVAPMPVRRPRRALWLASLVAAAVLVWALQRDTDAALSLASTPLPTPEIPKAAAPPAAPQLPAASSAPPPPLRVARPTAPTASASVAPPAPKSESGLPTKVR